MTQLTILCYPDPRLHTVAKPVAAQVGALLKSHGLMLATAESCTGGGVAQAITDVAGSSAWFERGFVTYSNLAKQQMLGVREATLKQHGKKC